MEAMWNSPFVVPVALFAMALGIVIVTQVTELKKRQMVSEERLAAIAKGLPLPNTEARHDALIPAELREQALGLRMAARRAGLARRWGIVLVSFGLGLAGFFLALAWILRERDVLSGVACSLIPFAVGLGLMVDAAIVKRENAELGSGSSGPQSGPQMSSELGLKI